MTKNYRKSQITYIHPMVAMNRVNNFDGNEETDENIEEGPIDRRCEGIVLGRKFFSYETIALAIIAIILFFKLK